MSVPELRFCPSCGVEVLVGARFCGGCGRPLPGQAPEPTAGRAGPPLWVWGIVGLVAVAAVVVVLVLVLGGGDGGPSADGVTTTWASTGGTARAVLSDGSELVGLGSAEAGQAPPEAVLDAGVAVGDAFLFEGDTGGGSVTVVLPFDPGLVPEPEPGAGRVVFAAFWDETAGVWVPVMGTVDWEAGTVTVETDHLSWWAPWTWDWDELGRQLAGAVTWLVEQAGVPVAEWPVCEGVRPLGVAIPTLETPGYRGVLAVCAEATGTDGLVRLRVVNGRAYGLLLQIPEGVVVESNPFGSAHAIVWQQLARTLPGETIYLSPAGGAVLLLDLNAYPSITLRGYPSELTMAADMLLWAVEVLISGGQVDLDQLWTDPNCAAAVLGGEYDDDPWGLIRECMGGAVNYWGPVLHVLKSVAATSSYWADLITTGGELTETVTITYEPIPPGAYPVAEVDACVIGSNPGDQVNVRSGPGSANGLVGTLAEDATGVPTTGWAARDSNGDEWRQILFGADTGWVFSDYLTPGACTLGPAQEYCLNETACTDTPNIRTGLGADYQAIGTLPPNAVGIQGTGATSVDEQGRTWVQIRHQGQVGWLAGWLLTDEPCSPTTCGDAPSALSSPRTLCPHRDVCIGCDPLPQGVDPDREMTADLNHDGIPETVTMRYLGNDGDREYDWAIEVEILGSSGVEYSVVVSTGHSYADPPASLLAHAELTGTGAEEVVVCDWSVPGNYQDFTTILLSKQGGQWRQVLVAASHYGSLVWTGELLEVAHSVKEGPSDRHWEYWYYRWSEAQHQFEMI